MELRAWLFVPYKQDSEWGGVAVAEGETQSHKEAQREGEEKHRIKGGDRE